MAFLFDSFKEGIIGGGTFGASDFQLDSNTIKVALIDTATDDPAQATDETWANISTALVGTATNVSIAAVTNGAVTVTGNSTTITSVSGATVEEVVTYDDTIVNDPLICCFESADSADLPFTPNGGDVTINWNASGIFAF